MKLLVSFAFLSLGLSLEARLPDLIPYRKGNLWGFCDSTKRIIIEPKWDEVSFFDGNAAPVKKNGKWGLIDRSGKVILKTEYFKIGEPSGYGRWIVEKTEDGVRGVVNDSGRFVIPLVYWDLARTGPYFQCYRKKWHCAIMDTNGVVIIPFGKYRSCTEGHESIGDSGLFVMEDNRGRRGVIDTSGTVIIPFVHKYIYAESPCTFRGLADTDSIVFYNTKGERVPANAGCDETKYSDLEYDVLVNGMYSFKSGGLVGYKDSTGHVVFPAQFKWGFNFLDNGLAKIWLVERNHGLMYHDGLVDKHGTKYWED